MKDFVKYDLVLKLKEKWFGYDLPITYDYKNQTYQHNVEPMIYQVLDWLRIEKNIDIVIYPIDASTLYMGGEKYILSTYHHAKRDYKIHHYNIDKYVKWEDAAVAGIEYVIDNLI